MHKVKLPLGPWSTEPNEKSWVDAATGLHCYIKRHPTFGHLCGYVGVPAGHPAYNNPYDKLTLNVHGGVTHADGIESSPMPDLWWIGFDCAHAFDYSPGMPQSFGVRPEAYRDMEYVTRECVRLAEQLKDYAPPMSVHEALIMVVRAAESNRNALTIEAESKLNEALEIVRGHADSVYEGE
jgi:hypothetical protein